MNKNESKYYSTAALFDEALIDLLDKKDIEYITIKEICKKAGFNRSTFYLHYESINDLLSECMEYINKRFIDYFNEDTNKFIKNINNVPLEELELIKSKYLIPYLNFVQENKNIFKASFNNPNGMKANERFYSLNKYILLPIMNRFNILEEKRKYILSFYIHGIMAIINEWLQNDCKESIEVIEEIIKECIKTSEEYIKKENETKI